MKNIALYARVSTQMQEEKQTIQSQLFKLREMTNGGNLVKEYIDNGWSGSTLARPALDELRDAVKEKKFEVLYVYDPDRLSRNHFHLGLLMEEFKKYGINLVFANREYKDNPEDNLLFGVQGLVAEYEREKIKERTRRGRLQKARRGLVVGAQAPYGYDYIKKQDKIYGFYKVKTEEKLVVELIFDLFLKLKSIRAVVGELEKIGIRPRGGQRYWAKSTIARILTNSTYIGTTYYNKNYSFETDNGKRYKRITKTGKKLRNKEEWVAIQVEPIVSKDIFSNVQSLLIFNKGCLRPKKNNYLLSGLLKCGICGSSYVGDPCKGVGSYRCSSRQRKNVIVEKCLNGEIKTLRIENAIWGEIKKVLQNPAIIISQLSLLSKNCKSKKGLMREKVKEVESIIEKKNESKQRLIKAYSSGHLSEFEFGNSIGELNKEVSIVEKQKSNLMLQLETIEEEPKKKKDIIYFCKKISKKLETAQFNEKREILRLLCEGIEFKKGSVLFNAIIPYNTVYSPPYQDVVSTAGGNF